jgi:hypothetical protein
MMKKILLVTLLMSLFSAAAVNADPYDRRWHQAHWGEGHWIHDRHGGRLGWWWVIGNDWHFYSHQVSQPQMVIIQQPAPVVIQQQPPTQYVIQQAPPAQPPVMAAPAPAPISPTMYFCKATGTYYPETMTCPNGWTPISAGAPPAP